MLPPNSIFISYRRSDSNDVVGRIYDRLAQHFGRSVVFKDVDSIPLGVDFRTHLNQGVGNCRVLIAVIGSTWLTVQDAAGRRLDNPNDWVRAEIETALGRNIPVIPLLIGGARMPGAEELPESLQGLAYRNAAQARPDPDFHHDLDRLIRNLEAVVGSPEEKPDPGFQTNASTPAPQPPAMPLNNLQRQRLEQERTSLQTTWDLRSQKLQQLRTALAIEASAATQFQLQQQIQAEEREIEDLETKLAQIEQTLSQGAAPTPSRAEPPAPLPSPDPRSPSNPTKKLSRFQKLELERLKTQLSDLEQDYEAVAAELRVALDPATRNKLEKRLTQIGQDMEAVEQEMEKFSASE